jgi:hypothetical protein
VFIGSYVKSSNIFSATNYARLLIQPSYSIEDIYLALIDQNQNHFVVKWRRLGTSRFLIKMLV